MKHIQFDESQKQRLLMIDWFANCGLDVDLNDGMIKISKEEAFNHYISEEWEYFLLREMNFVTVYLSENFKNEYNTYFNIVTVEIRNFIITHIESNMRLRGLFDEKLFIDSTRWFTLRCLQCLCYSECDLPDNPFSKILDLYESGHLPCGWIGNRWPDGKLLVY